MALNLSVTLLPGLLLYAVALSLAPSQFAKVGAGLDRPRDRRCIRWSSPSSTSLVALAVSSLSTQRARGRPRVLRPDGRAGDRARHRLRRCTDQPESLLLSLPASMQAVGNALFGITARGLRPALDPARAGPGPGRPRLPGHPARPRARGGDRAMTAAIEYVRASRWYGPVIALNDVTTVVEPGVTGLLGPNGAGKSTFLKLAAGQLAPSQGEVQRARPAGLGLAGGLPPRRAVPGGGRVLGRHDRAAVRDRAPAAHRLRRGGVPAARGGGAGRGRAPRREGPQDRRLQQGHAAAREARAGHRPRPAGAAARRAGQRDGPREPPARGGPREAARPRGQDGARLQPHPPRGRGHDPARPAHPQRPHPGRGRRARDPRPHGRAPAHRRPARPGPARRWPGRWWARRTSCP